MTRSIVDCLRACKRSWKNHVDACKPKSRPFSFYFFIRVLRARVDVCMDRKNNLLTLKALDPYPKNKKNKKKKKRKAFYPAIDSHVPENPSVCVHEEAKR